MNLCTLNVTLDINWHIKIVNFHFLTVKGIQFDPWSLKMHRRQFRNRLSPEEMNCGIKKLESGVFQRRVAWILNVSQSVIFRMWNRHLIHRDPSHRHGGGRDRTATQRQGRFLLIQSRRQRFHNATSLNNEFWNGTGERISTQTVRNRLHEFGLNARRPSLRVPLTRQHVQDWLDFARIHVRWTIRDWTTVLFTDESRFCLDFTDRRQLESGECPTRDLINWMR